MNITSALSTYLKAADLNGQTIRVTINSVEMEKVGQEKEQKPVLYTNGPFEKGIVLNVTNANAISDVYGEETGSWANQPLDLYPDKTSFGGKQVDCIRMKVPVVEQALGDQQQAPF